MVQKEADHPLNHYFTVFVALDAGLDTICRNAPGFVYAYSKNAFGYTDSIIALTKFDLMALAFGSAPGILLHREAVEYQPLRKALEISEGSVPQIYYVQYSLIIFKQYKILLYIWICENKGQVWYACPISTSIQHPAK